MPSVTRVPGPRGSWVLGNLRELRDGAHVVFARWAERYGDLVAMRAGTLRIVLVMHPDLVEEVLVTKAKHFRKPRLQRMFRPALGDGLFLSEGEHWRRQRRMIAPQFRQPAIAGYVDAMVSAAEVMLQRWGEGGTREAYSEVTEMALEVVSRALFGTQSTEDARRGRIALSQVMRVMNARLKLPIQLPEWLPLPMMRRVRRAVAELDDVLYGFIARRRADPQSAERTDFLSMLLAMRDEDDGTGMTDAQVRDEAMTLFLAGFETTAIALIWTFWLLAQHPTWAARVAEEADAVLGERRPTIADVKRLVVTERLVKESMRLYPPFWALGREVIADVELGGYAIPRGHDVMVTSWVTHRDRRFWSEPDAFDPDRWTTEAVKALPRYAYFPFGGGPRICIGNFFAMTEAVLVTAMVAQRYRLALPAGHAVRPTPGFSLRPRPDVQLVVARR